MTDVYDINSRLFLNIDLLPVNTIIFNPSGDVEYANELAIKYFGVRQYSDLNLTGAFYRTKTEEFIKLIHELKYKKIISDRIIIVNLLNKTKKQSIIKCSGTEITDDKRDLYTFQFVEVTYFQKLNYKKLFQRINNAKELQEIKFNPISNNKSFRFAMKMFQMSFPELTEDECNYCILLIAGLNIHEIAQKMELTFNEANLNVLRTLKKIDINNRSELILKYRLLLIDNLLTD